MSLADRPYVTPSQLKKIMILMASRRRPLMVHGPMGIGKTKITGQVATEYGHRLVPLHLPQYDPTDLKGIPIKEGNIVKWVTSSFLPNQNEIIIIGDSGECTCESIYGEDFSLHLYDPTGKLVARQNDRLFGQDFCPPNITITRSADRRSYHVSGVSGYRLVVMDKAWLFADEFSGAHHQIQNAFLQVPIEWKIAETILPINCPISAAGNLGAEDGAFTYSLTAPMISRFNHQYLRESADDFIQYGEMKGYHGAVLGYIRQYANGNDKLHGNVLNDYSPTRIANGDLPFPTPRNWENIALADIIDTNGREDSFLRQQFIFGEIGVYHGRLFENFLKTRDDLPDLDLVMQGKIGTIKKLSIGQRFMLAYGLFGKIRDYHQRYYKPGVANSQQPTEWKIAGSVILPFLDEHVGADLTNSVIGQFVAAGISLAHFRYDGFDKLATKYTTLRTAMIG